MDSHGEPLVLVPEVKEDRYVVYCRLTPHLFEKLEKLAEADGRSLPNMVRRLIATASL